jgi:omega-hydroxy-beta-dihydromenaquinone-9 sulfotransferase
MKNDPPRTAAAPPPEGPGLIPARPQDFGYSRFALRLWHGMTLGAFLRLMRGNYTLVAPARFGLFVSVLALSLGNSALKCLSVAIYGRRLARVRISPEPLFVLGHWRSGTTWLNQMLDCDDRLVSPNAMQCFSPETFLGARFFLRPLLALIMPARRPMDNVALTATSAEEDEHGILLSGAATPYRSIAFPCDQIAGMEARPEDMTAPEAAFWRNRWLGFLARVQLINPGRRLMLKSPLHTLRLPEILRHFPNAKFVHIVRDPYRIHLSRQKSGAAMMATQAFQTKMPGGARHQESQLQQFVDFHERYHQTRGLIPPENLITIRYEDLCADPRKVLRDVYEQLQIGEFAEVEPKLDAYIAARKDYKTNRFDLASDVEAAVWTRWRDYFDRYGYQRMSERP